MAPPRPRRGAGPEGCRGPRGLPAQAPLAPPRGVPAPAPQQVTARARAPRPLPAPRLCGTRSCHGPARPAVRRPRVSPGRRRRPARGSRAGSWLPTVPGRRLPGPGAARPRAGAPGKEGIWEPQGAPARPRPLTRGVGGRRRGHVAGAAAQARAGAAGAPHKGQQLRGPRRRLPASRLCRAPGGAGRAVAPRDLGPRAAGPPRGGPGRGGGAGAARGGARRPLAHAPGCSPCEPPRALSVGSRRLVGVRGAEPSSGTLGRPPTPGRGIPRPGPPQRALRDTPWPSAVRKAPSSAFSAPCGLSRVVCCKHLLYAKQLRS